MGDLYVSWADYHQSIERLARKIVLDGYRFNQVVCIARGGLRVGDTLSRIFKQPLAILSTQSYSGEAGTERGELTVAKTMTMTTPALGDAVLLVDDLVDSGITLDVVARHLRAEYPHVKSMKSAVLWYKACSKYTPDFYVDYLPENPWIHQPFEPYDTMRPEEILQRVD